MEEDPGSENSFKPTARTYEKLVLLNAYIGKKNKGLKPVTSAYTLMNWKKEEYIKLKVSRRTQFIKIEVEID